MWSKILGTAITLYFQTCVFCININNQFSGVRRECGSFAAVAHLTSASLSDRVRDNSSALMTNGGAAALHNSATNLRSSTHKCGASLISDRYLLTAAHCMVSSARIISISLGREDLNVNSSPGPDTYNIQNVYRHHNYRSGTHDYADIAILKTDRKVRFSNKVWPFCLPASNQEFDNFLTVKIAGWGQVNQSHTSPLIQTAYVKIVENSQCDLLWRQHAPDNYAVIRQLAYPQGLTKQILCAGGEGVDACNGDSGGPMSYQNTDGLHTIIGIIAKGINCPIFPITPGFYTNVAFYIDWIYSTTGIPRPSASTNIPQPRPPPPPAVNQPSGKPVFGFNGPPDVVNRDNCNNFYFSTEKTTWEDARRRCALRGSDLAVPASSDGSCILGSLDQEINKDKWNAAFWVGASGITFRGRATYTWLTGRSMNGPWLSGDPDSSTSSDVCVWVYNLPVIDYKGYGVRPCSSQEFFVCSQ